MSANTKWTAEPWRHDNASSDLQMVRCPTGAIVATCDSTWPNTSNEANAARIVACVNACAGMEDPAAAIEGARKALRAAGMSLRRSWGDGVKSYPESIRDALRALGAKP